MRLWQRSMLATDSIKSALRYGLVGIIQNALSYSILLVLIWVGWPAWQAVLVLTPLAMIASFLVNRAWTFGNARRQPGQFQKYAATSISLYIGAVALTWIQESIGVPSSLAALITTGVAAVAGYTILNVWVFPPARSSSFLNGVERQHPKDCSYE